MWAVIVWPVLNILMINFSDANTIKYVVHYITLFILYIYFVSLLLYVNCGGTKRSMFCFLIITNTNNNLAS